MGHDCDFYIHNSQPLRQYHYYLFFNFSQFEKQYGWHINMAHGHTVQTIMKQLAPIIQKLETDVGITHDQSCIYLSESDAWSPIPIVFPDHLRSLYHLCFEIAQEYPDDKVVMYRDQDYRVIPYQIVGYQSDGCCSCPKYSSDDDTF